MGVLGSQAREWKRLAHTESRILSSSREHILLFSALVKNYSENKEQWGSVPPQELGLCLSAESSHAEETQEQAVRDLIRL